MLSNHDGYSYLWLPGSGIKRELASFSVPTPCTPVLGFGPIECRPHPVCGTRSRQVWRCLAGSDYQYLLGLRLERPAKMMYVAIAEAKPSMLTRSRVSNGVMVTS